MPPVDATAALGGGLDTTISPYNVVVNMTVVPVDTKLFIPAGDPRVLALRAGVSEFFWDSPFDSDDMPNQYPGLLATNDADTAGIYFIRGYPILTECYLAVAYNDMNFFEVRVAFTRGQRIYLFVDPINNRVRIDGCNEGNGTYDMSESFNNWWPPNNSLVVGGFRMDGYDSFGQYSNIINFDTASQLGARQALAVTGGARASGAAGLAGAQGLAVTGSARANTTTGLTGAQALSVLGRARVSSATALAGSAQVAASGTQIRNASVAVGGGAATASQGRARVNAAVAVGAAGGISVTSTEPAPVPVETYVERAELAQLYASRIRNEHFTPSRTPYEGVTSQPVRAGMVYSGSFELNFLTGSSSAAGLRYLQLFDLARTPQAGQAQPVYVKPVLAGDVFNISLRKQFKHGCAFALSTTPAVYTPAGSAELRLSSFGSATF